MRRREVLKGLAALPLAGVAASASAAGLRRCRRARRLRIYGNSLCQHTYAWPYHLDERDFAIQPVMTATTNVMLGKPGELGPAAYVPYQAAKHGQHDEVEAVIFSGYVLQVGYQLQDPLVASERFMNMVLSCRDLSDTPVAVVLDQPPIEERTVADPDDVDHIENPNLQPLTVDHWATWLVMLWRVAVRARDEGVPVLDASRYVSRTDYSDAVHLTEEGNGKLARDMVPWLKDVCDG